MGKEAAEEWGGDVPASDKGASCQEISKDAGEPNPGPAVGVCFQRGNGLVRYTVSENTIISRCT